MTIQTATMKNALAAAYAAQATYGALYSTVPGANAGTELSGGTPAYARKPLTWSAPNNGLITATATFDVPSGATVAGSGVHTAATAGTYLDGGAVATQPYNSQGQYVMQFSYQEQ